MKAKVLKVMIMFFLISLIMVTNSDVFAIRDPAEVAIADRISGGDELEAIGKSVFGAVTIIGYAMAIIILIAMGIKYMTGSIEEKAGYKKSMIPYFVGCVILVLAPTLTNLVYIESKQLKSSAVIYTYYCQVCRTVGTNCSDKEAHKTNMTPTYYCTYCEKLCGNPCSTCKREYEGG